MEVQLAIIAAVCRSAQSPKNSGRETGSNEIILDRLKLKLAALWAVRVAHQFPRHLACIEALAATHAAPRFQRREVHCVVYKSAAVQTHTFMLATGRTNHIPPNLGAKDTKNLPAPQLNILRRGVLYCCGGLNFGPQDLRAEREEGLGARFSGSANSMPQKCGDGARNSKPTRCPLSETSPI